MVEEINVFGQKETGGVVGENVTRKYQDSIFRDMFNRNEEVLFSLYRTLHPEDASLSDVTEDNLKLITLQNVVTDRIRNDVAFRDKDTIMFLIEHQSTIDWNMPLRLLLGFSINFLGIE